MAIPALFPLLVLFGAVPLARQAGQANLGFFSHDAHKAFSSSTTVARHEFAARATDWQSVTSAELRVTQALVKELGEEAGHLDDRVSALEETRGELRSLATQFCALLKPTQ